MFDHTNRLQGRVALVTGASRGAGRGIACVLGEAGATVYVTGRSVRGGATTENLPETIDETADLVTARGGQGIAVRCDHTRDGEVAALFDRIRRERSRLDLLVNNAWGGYEGYDAREFDARFWEMPARYWDGMFTAGVRAHLMAARLAAPLMVAQHSGLIVSTVAWDDGKFLGNVFYDTAKQAIVRMIRGMARNLKPCGVAALALALGFTRTERVLEAHRRHGIDLGRTESPEYAGRAVVALAADAHILARTGSVYRTGDLAREYGFTDVDGTQPEAFVLPEEYRFEEMPKSREGNEQRG